MKKVRAPKLNPHDGAVTLLFRILRHTPPHQLAEGLADGVKLIAHLLDRKSVLALRRILRERYTGNRSLLDILDRHMEIASGGRKVG